MRKRRSWKRRRKIFRRLLLSFVFIILMGFGLRNKVKSNFKSQKQETEVAEVEEKSKDNKSNMDEMEKKIKRETIDRSKLVAHGGGAVYGLNYTNSLEALNRAYGNGFRYIELDFQLTKDNQVVLIHDWEGSVELLFKIPPRVLSYEEFKNMPTILDLKLMDLNDLIKWLDGHRDVKIITDTENSNIDLLTCIQKNYPDYINRFIPQIYRFEEYEQVRNLGYEDIILTLYMSNKTDDEIYDFARENHLYGVTIEHKRAFNWLTRRLSEAGIRVYAHTINSLEAYYKLKDVGIYGIYTDYFELNDFPLN